MKVQSHEKMVKLFTSIKRFLPRQEEGGIVPPLKILTNRNVDQIIERLEKEAFETDETGLKS